MSSSEEIRDLMDRFAGAPEAVAEKVRNLSKEQMAYRPFPEAWTIHEHLVHLADSEINGAVRLRKILAESGVSVDVFDEEKWAASLSYQRQPADRALAIFRLLREIAVDLLGNAPEAAWDTNYVLHPQRGRVSLRGWLTIYVEHSDTHLQYIERNLKMWGER
jgi:hypothetical protein